jgi:hypothetical protein
MWQRDGQQTHPKLYARVYLPMRAADSIKEKLLRFVEPDKRGKFLRAFEDFLAAALPCSEFATYRAEIEADPLAAVHSLVKPFLRYGMADEFDRFVTSLKRTRE